MKKTLAEQIHALDVKQSNEATKAIHYEHKARAMRHKATQHQWKYAIAMHELRKLQKQKDREDAHRPAIEHPNR